MTHTFFLYISRTLPLCAASASSELFNLVFNMLILTNRAILVNSVIFGNMAKVVILVNQMFFSNLITLVVQVNLKIMVNLVILVYLVI